jgi:hypothetical protein
LQEFLSLQIDKTAYSTVVDLVVGESYRLAERDTCYFTAAFATALAAVGAAISAVTATAMIAVSVATTITVSAAAIPAALWLIVCLQRRTVAADTMVKLVREQEVYFR